MTDPTTPVPDVYVNAFRIGNSRYVSLEGSRRLHMQMRDENPSLPEATPLPCIRYIPRDSQELEDKIYILASILAAQIVELMNQNPGLEFGSIITVELDGSLTAQSFQMPTDHRTALNVAGVNHGRVVAMIHGHPKQPIGYPNPLYNSALPAYGLMPSPRTTETDANGVTTEYGDWVSHQYWLDQIAIAGGRADLFRQYIVGYGAYAPMQRPKWHLTEPQASLRWTATDYAQDPANKMPPTSLPIGINVEICP